MLWSVPLLAYGCLTAARAQSPPDVQSLVQRLYPKDDRLKTIRMADIAAQLRIQPGSLVADVGCGPGDFSVILAHIVEPRGSVVCEDINAGKEWGLRTARANARHHHTKNIVWIHGTAGDPQLKPNSLDAVLVMNAYHEMVMYQEMLRHIREALKPDGRLVIVDNHPRRTAARPRDKQTNNHVLSVDLAAGELEAAGFRILARDDGFIADPDSESAQWLIAAAPR